MGFKITKKMGRDS